MMSALGGKAHFWERQESHQKGGSYYFSTLSQVFPSSSLRSPLYIGVLGYPLPFFQGLACIYIKANLSQDIKV